MVSSASSSAVTETPGHDLTGSTQWVRKDPSHGLFPLLSRVTIKLSKRTYLTVVWTSASLQLKIPSFVPFTSLRTVYIKNTEFRSAGVVTSCSQLYIFPSCDTVVLKVSIMCLNCSVMCVCTESCSLPPQNPTQHLETISRLWWGLYSIRGPCQPSC